MCNVCQPQRCTKFENDNHPRIHEKQHSQTTHAQLLNEKFGNLSTDTEKLVATNKAHPYFDVRILVKKVYNKRGVDYGKLRLHLRLVDSASLCWSLESHLESVAIE